MVLAESNGKATIGNFLPSRVRKAILLLIAFIISLYAQNFEERANSKTILDPKGVTLSGAGQDGCACANSFDNYWKTAPEGQKPVIFMDYVDPWHMRPNWSNDLKEKIMRYHRQGYYVLPQIGFKIEHDYKQINAGTMEKELDNFIKGFEYLAIPCYVRIGYEFNNIYKKYGGNNRDTAGYIACFQRVAKKIKESNLEIATVWCAGLSGESPVMQSWYPGDEYVDWFGIDCFADIYNGVHAVTIEMCTNAAEKNKPLLIGESSPMWMNGSNTGSLDWYKSLYKMVGEQPTIKALGYINWDWDIEDMNAGNLGFGWGDARLEAFPNVKEYFFEQLENPGYFHASSEQEFRALLDYNDNTPPSAVTGLKKDGNRLVWNPVEDNTGSKFAHYTIYKDGKLWDYMINPYYDIIDLGVGKSASVHVVAVDRAGNIGGKSSSLTVEQVNSINLIENGTFDLPRTTFENDWTFRAANDGKVAEDDFETDSTGKLTGPYSAKVTWTATPKDPAIWKLQLFQEFLVKKDHKYRVSFRAVADKEIKATVGFMANAIQYMNTHVQWGNDMDFENEWHKFNMWEVDIGTEAKTYNFTGTADRDEIARLSFMFGTCPGATVWVDDVSLINDYQNAIHINQPQLSHNYILNQNIPNPISTTTTIAYTIPKKTSVTLSIHTLNGKKIKTLVNTVQNSGTHQANWDATNMPSGVYLFRFKSDAFTAVRRCVVKR